MDSAKEFAKEYQAESGQRPFLSFADMQPHTVTLLSDKRDQLDDPNNAGEKIDGVRFVAVEDDVEKEFFTSSIALIQKLASCNAGETVTIQMTKGKNAKGAFRTSYTVKRQDGEVRTAHEEEADEDEAPSEPKW